MVYLDDFFFDVTDQYHIYRDISELPERCDIIAKTFYHLIPTDEIKSLVPLLKSRCRKLIVMINEPTGDTVSLKELLLELDDPDIHFFGDAVLNFDFPRWQNDQSWFITARNFYAQDPWAQYLLAMVSTSSLKPKRFDCLLGRTRKHRDIVAGFYKNSKYKDMFYYTYFGDDIQQGSWDIDLDQHKMTSDTINYCGSNVNISAILPLDIYNQTCYSIVAESSCVNDHSHFTEKVAKPLMCQRPFVVFAGQHYLRNLRSLGFRTFGDVIDESYDLESCHDTRLHLAWQQVEWLCQQDPREILASLQHTLLHNAQHFIQTDWHANVKQFIQRESGAG
jgi:hypothetical protein